MYTECASAMHRANVQRINTVTLRAAWYAFASQLAQSLAVIHDQHLLQFSAEVNRQWWLHGPGRLIIATAVIGGTVLTALCIVLVVLLGDAL